MGSGMPIGVIGAGPVGTIVAAHLVRGGHDVTLVDSWAERAEQVAAVGLRVTGKLDVPAQRPRSVLRTVEELEGVPLGALFVCTKTSSLRALLPRLARVLDRDAIIVSFQNGIGPEDEIAKVFPRERVCRGIVNFAGGVQPDGSVVMQWFNAPNHFGALDGSPQEAQRLADAMTEAGLASTVVGCHDIKQQVFYKTILNSALNALCASSGITMRRAMSMPHTRQLAQLLIREGLSVATAVGYYYGEDSLARCMNYLDQGGDHLPSMWVDLQRGLPTEIEYINGRIVQIGMMFKNVDVDVNVFFTSMIITEEIKSGVRAPDDIPEYLTHF